jgi:hypothetical protein
MRLSERQWSVRYRSGICSAVGVSRSFDLSAGVIAVESADRIGYFLREE